ncbi:MAG TPA: FKBP-type peptidyl-prolyl cis-trans isomerase [Actinomycetota bacterium]|nr:FKBP-type peptidyl-prolyl cis-trans isomerase [Actinomycetota bacterium]
MEPLEISEDLSAKPGVPPVSGPPPRELYSTDVVKGNGPTAVSGMHVWVHYVGVSYSTGKQFDSSWDRGDAFSFPLGGGRVIPGWDFGVSGMKVGGRRLLVIPPNMGYGARAVGSIKPNETMIFVVDLLKVG